MTGRRDEVDAHAGGEATANAGARLGAIAAASGLPPLATGVTEALLRYGKLLLDWNRRINLGGAGLAKELIDRHLLDALVASAHVGDGPSLVDVGSGGGLPAIPLALLCPRLTVDLFEAVAKKAAFLRTAVRELGLSDRATVHASRVELPPGDGLAGAFDVACSRATLAPIDWLAMGRALVRPGGRVLVFATGNEKPAMPPAGRAVAYAPDRRLLVYLSPDDAPAQRST